MKSRFLAIALALAMFGAIVAEAQTNKAKQSEAFAPQPPSVAQAAPVATPAPKKAKHHKVVLHPKKKAHR